MEPLKHLRPATCAAPGAVPHITGHAAWLHCQGRQPTRHYKRAKQSNEFVPRATAAADLGSLLSQTQTPSTGEMWDLGFADCEAETCGLVPDGSLVLVILPQHHSNNLPLLLAGSWSGVAFMFLNGAQGCSFDCQIAAVRPLSSL